MDIETCKSICHGLAKAFTTGVRLYENESPLYYYAPYPIEPDPLEPYLHQIIDSDHEAGIITTSLYQFYAFLTLGPGIRMIVGPTRALIDNGKEMDELLALLGVEENAKEAYIRLLCSAPVININRYAWLLVALTTILKGHPFSIEEIWMEKTSKDTLESVQAEYSESRMNNEEDMGVAQAVKQRLSWEELIISYVECGKTEQLRELFSSPPKIYRGSMGYDMLRQTKNIGIRMISFVSRAAVQGGLDQQQAFLAADLYMQKLEGIQDISNAEKLIQEMILDFAEQVEKLRCPAGNESKFCRMCIHYISRNIFSMIRLEQMAKELDYSRTYMCSRFKKETGLSLTQYIQREKVEEAKRFLRFSDRELSEIASILSFSSQSHFQTVFKKVTGETPLAYRMRVKNV